MTIPKQKTGQGSEMPQRTLGKTGESVSCIGLGGFHLGLSRLEEADANKLFQAAIDRGINFSDNSWDYNQGESERRVGKGLKGRREKVFVMSEFDGRTKSAALSQLDQSLQRLGVDHLDLWQFHENIRLEDPDRFFVKHRDRFASAKDVTVERPRSAVSNRLLAQIARDARGDVERASTGDPTKRRKTESGNLREKNRMRGQS
jgi:aryl-alcohol dehydrogenase-like predicted oxidoreductase